jgi:hypothetical protein
MAAKKGMRRAPKRAWTARERAYVIASYGRVPTDEMARHLGRPEHAVRAAARRWGVRTHYVTLPSDARLMRMYREGLDDGWIAACVGCTRAAVGKWRRRKGLPLVRRRSAEGE